MSDFFKNGPAMRSLGIENLKTLVVDFLGFSPPANASIYGLVFFIVDNEKAIIEDIEALEKLIGGYVLASDGSNNLRRRLVEEFFGTGNPILKGIRKYLIALMKIRHAVDGTNSYLHSKNIGNASVIRWAVSSWEWVVAEYEHHVETISDEVVSKSDDDLDTIDCHDEIIALVKLKLSATRAIKKGWDRRRSQKSNPVKVQGTTKLPNFCDELWPIPSKIKDNVYQFTDREHRQYHWSVPGREVKSADLTRAQPFFDQTKEFNWSDLDAALDLSIAEAHRDQLLANDKMDSICIPQNFIRENFEAMTNQFATRQKEIRLLKNNPPSFSLNHFPKIREPRVTSIGTAEAIDAFAQTYQGIDFDPK